MFENYCYKCYSIIHGNNCLLYILRDGENKKICVFNEKKTVILSKDFSLLENVKYYTKKIELVFKGTLKPFYFVIDNIDDIPCIKVVLNKESNIPIDDFDDFNKLKTVKGNSNSNSKLKFIINKKPNTSPSKNKKSKTVTSFGSSRISPYFNSTNKTKHYSNYSSKTNYKQNKISFLPKVEEIEKVQNELNILSYTNNNNIDNTNINDCNNNNIISDNNDIINLTNEDSQELKNKYRGGIMNLGNTCYMNSVLEALTSIDSFRQDLCGISISTLLSKEQFYSCLCNIMKEREINRDKIIDPTLLKKAISLTYDNFEGYEQQDAHEFLCACFNQIEKDIYPYFKNNNISQICITDKEIPTIINFGGELEYSMTCLSCNKKETTKENFYFLTLSIPEDEYKLEDFKLIDLLYNYFAEEEYEKRCSCGSNNWKRIPKISVLPRVLIIQIRRFRFDTLTLSLDKVDDKVIPTDILSLEEYCLPLTKNPLWFSKTSKLTGKRLFYKSQPPLKKQKTNFGFVDMKFDSKSQTLLSNDNFKANYKIRAVVKHHGSVNYGHYTCNIFNDNDKCEHCDDSIVSLVSHNDALIESQDGYLFFYVHENIK